MHIEFAVLTGAARIAKTSGRSAIVFGASLLADLLAELRSPRSKRHSQHIRLASLCHSTLHYDFSFSQRNDKVQRCEPASTLSMATSRAVPRQFSPWPWSFHQRWICLDVPYLGQRVCQHSLRQAHPRIIHIQLTWHLAVAIVEVRLANAKRSGLRFPGAPTDLQHERALSDFVSALRWLKAALDRRPGRILQ